MIVAVNLGVPRALGWDGVLGPPLVLREQAPTRGALLDDFETSVIDRVWTGAATRRVGHNLRELSVCDRTVALGRTSARKLRVLLQCIAASAQKTFIFCAGLKTPLVAHGGRFPLAQKFVHPGPFRALAQKSVPLSVLDEQDG